MKRDYGFVVQRRDGRIETFQTHEAIEDARNRLFDARCGARFIADVFSEPWFQPKYWGGLMISRAIAIDIQSGDILKC
jgi:hypothetical protein